MLCARTATLSVLFLMLGCVGTARAIEPEISGDITLNFARIVDGLGNVTGYQYTGSTPSLTINGNLPIIVPIAIRDERLGQPGLFWTDVTNWNNPTLLCRPVFTITKFVTGLGSGEPSISDTIDVFDALVNSGPTEQTVSISPIKITSPNIPGFEARFGGGLAFKYDVTLPTGADVLMDQAAVLEKLTIEHGAKLVGNPGMVIRTDLVNSGYFGNLSGTVQGDFYNNGNHANNERAYVNGTLNVNGQLYNTGEIHVASGLLKLLPAGTSNTHDGILIIEGGSFQYGTTFTNYGTLDVRTGGVYGTGSLTSSGTLKWIGGYLPSNITSSGQFIVSGMTEKIVDSGTIHNSGTLTHQADGLFNLGSNATFYNDASGVYDLQGDADLTSRWTRDYSSNPVFYNSGTLRKSSGSGESLVGSSNYGIVFRNSGTVEVDSGTLKFQGGYTQTAGRIILQSATLKSSYLDIQGGSIQGTGTIDGSLSNKGTISPGFSAGRIDVLGNLTLLSGSAMIFDIGGRTQGTDYDLLNVSGTTALNGTLSLDLLNGFEHSISPSEIFTILDAGSTLTGAFTNITSGQRLTTVDGLGSFQINYGSGSSYGSDKITLSNFQAVPEPSIVAMLICALISLGIYLKDHRNNRIHSRV